MSGSKQQANAVLVQGAWGDGSSSAATGEVNKISAAFPYPKQRRRAVPVHVANSINGTTSGALATHPVAELAPLSAVDLL